MADQKPWPPIARSPAAFTASPDGFLKSDRSLAGPLRLGTAPGVGPRGRGRRGEGLGDSDFGMDRVTPRGFDPMGTSLEREPRQESSRLVSEQVRRGTRR